MIIELNQEDMELLIQSMQYTRDAFRNTGIAPHGSYPSYEFKCARETEAQALLEKLRTARRKDSK